MFTHSGGNSRNYWTFEPPVFATPTPLDPGNYGTTEKNTNEVILCVAGPMTTVRVVKVGGSQQPLAGAVFTVYLNGVPFTYTDPFGTTRSITATTDVNGVATLVMSLPGTYTLVETTAPPGYPLPDPAPSLPFTVTDEARTIVVGTVVNTTTTTTTTTTSTTTPTIAPPVVIVTTTEPPTTLPPTTLPPTTLAAVVAPDVVTTTTLSITASPAEVLGVTAARELPYTGAETSALTMLAVALIAAGLLLTLVPDRKARTS